MSKKVIELLNQARARELGAISQYMTQHYELEDKDYGKLASKLKETAITEMKHAEKLAERILFLNGKPTTKPSGEALKTDIGLEDDAIKLYNEAAVICAAEKDHVSKGLFEDLLKDEDDHINMFQNIRDLVGTLGAPYLASLTGK